MYRTGGLFHSGPISGVAASRDHIATAGYDNAVVLWSATSHTPINRVCHDHLANQCEFSPNGQYLVSASSDYTARVFSVPGLQLRGVINHDDDVMKATFSPDGDRVATGGYDGTVKISNLDGGRIAECCGHTAAVESIAWSTDGATCASCGTDGTIRVWDAASGDCLIVKAGFETHIDAIVHMEGDLWIAGTDEGRLLLIGPGPISSFPGHGAGVKSLSRCENRLLSTGYDQRFIIWSIEPDQKLAKISDGVIPYQVWARSACLFGDGKIIFASFGSRYFVYDIAEKTWDFRGYTPSPSHNAICVRGDHIYTVGDAGVVYVDGSPGPSVPSLCNAVAVVGDMILVAGQSGTLFNVETGEELYSHGAPINRIELVSEVQDGIAKVVLGTYDGMVAFLTITAGAVSNVRTIHVAHSAVKGIYSRDGRVFCGSAGGTLAVVDNISGQILHRKEDAHSSILNDISFYRNGFVTVSRDLTMRCWNNECELEASISTRHHKSVKCVSTSKDGRYSASGSYGGTIDIYDHQEKCWNGPLRRPTMAGISSIAWNAERQSFVAASYDGYVYEICIHED